MKIVTIAVGILISIHCFGQMKRVTGVLTDENNSPMPGANVLIKGSNTGTTTDSDGRYSIDAPIGSIIVFSFIGMQTREAIVTERGLSGVRYKIPPATTVNKLYPASWAGMELDTTGWNKPGVASLNNNTGHILNTTSVNPDELLKIRRFGRNFLFLTGQPVASTPVTFQLTTSVGYEQVNRWPSLQSTFAQGRSTKGSTQWRGSEQGEQFSYGPLIRTLEFDGSDYPFDSNGRLVAKGTGNGNAAVAYDPLQLLRNIFSSSTQLTAVLRLPDNARFIGSAERRDRSGIIPGSWTSHDNYSLRLTEFSVFNKLKVSASTSYQNAEGKLLPHGANLSNIIYNVYRTAPTLDNSKINDEIKALPDRDKNRRSLSMLSFSYIPNNDLRVNINANFEYQQSKIINGTTGRLTHRDLSRQNSYNITSITYERPSNWWTNSVLVAWHVNYESNDLNRSDVFTDTSIETKNRSTRTTNEIIAQGNFTDDALHIKFANRAYFSNTAAREKYINAFPSATVEYDFQRLTGWQQLKPYVSASRNIHEAPMIWSNWSHASTRMNLQSAMSFYEAGEVFFDKSLSPETDLKFETGVKSQFNRFTFDFNYYNNNTNDMVTPVWGDQGFQLMNAARVNTSGVMAQASYFVYLWDVHLQASVNWNKYNSVVSDVYAPGDLVQVAGFSEVAAVLAKGQPLGAIYGTSYQRDRTGALLIDSDGFPVVDSRVKMIGNPIPNWIGGTSISASWRNKIRVWTTLDYRNGGQRWNGTNRILDYYGVSQASAEQRNINNYVFDGNDVNGKPNLAPVSFADVSHETSSNRWVRDGYVGAAEQYIEDASWTRMSELGISYSTRTRTSALMRSIKVAIVATNVFLITKYHGVDPSTAFLGYTSGSGLDFFNVPGVRGVTASVSLNF